jgi:hypothetical protein
MLQIYVALWLAACCLTPKSSMRSGRNVELGVKGKFKEAHREASLPSVALPSLCASCQKMPAEQISG